MLRDFEREFAAPLLEKTRGRGTSLTPLAEKLIWADKRITARLTPILESFASELEAILTRELTALRITASHGFAVDALIKRLNLDHTPVEINYRSSLEAVAALSHDECDLAGFHVPVGEFRQAARHYLKWLDPAQHTLIHLACRTQGLFIARGNPKKIQGLKDLLRNDVRFVNRQTGSGTKILLEDAVGQGKNQHQKNKRLRQHGIYSCSRSGLRCQQYGRHGLRRGNSRKTIRSGLYSDCARELFVRMQNKRPGSESAQIRVPPHAERFVSQYSRCAGGI